MAATNSAAAPHATLVTAGLPPSWARPPDVERALLERLRDEGHLAGRKTRRLKFLWFPADSPRPPFYGSISRTRCTLIDIWARLPGTNAVVHWWSGQSCNVKMPTYPGFYLQMHGVIAECGC